MTDSPRHAAASSTNLVPFPSAPGPASQAPSSSDETAFATAPLASSASSEVQSALPAEDEAGASSNGTSEEPSNGSSHRSMPFDAPHPSHSGPTSAAHPFRQGASGSGSGSNGSKSSSDVDKRGLAWVSTPSRAGDISLPSHSASGWSRQSSFDRHGRPVAALGFRGPEIGVSETEEESRGDVGEGPSRPHLPYRRSSSVSAGSGTVAGGHPIGLGLTLREAPGSSSGEGSDSTTPDNDPALRGRGLMERQLDSARLSSDPAESRHPLDLQGRSRSSISPPPALPRTRLTSLPPASLPRASPSVATTTPPATTEGSSRGHETSSRESSAAAESLPLNGKGKQKATSAVPESLQMTEMYSSRPSAYVERPMPSTPSPAGRLHVPTTTRPRSSKPQSDLQLQDPAGSADLERTGTGRRRSGRSPVVPMEFGHPRLDLGMIEYAHWPAKVIYLALPIWVFAHIPVTIFLDYNALFVLVQIAHFPSANGQPRSPSDGGARAWWIAVAAYALATAAWLLGVVVGKDLWWEYGRRRRARRVSMVDVYLSSACFSLFSLRSFAYFSFLYRVRLSAFPPLSKALRSGAHGAAYPARWSDGLAESCWWYAQNWLTVVTLLPRAGLALAVLLAFFNAASDQSTPGRRDDSYFDNDGSLSTYAKAVLIINAVWGAWRLLVVVVASIGLVFFIPLARASTAPPPPLRRPTYNTRSSEPAVPVRSQGLSRRGWQDRLEARLGAAVLYCSSRGQWLESRQGLGHASSPRDAEVSHGAEQTVVPMVGAITVGAATVDSEAARNRRSGDSTGSWQLVSECSEATAQPPLATPIPTPGALTGDPRRPNISTTSETTQTTTATRSKGMSVSTTDGPASEVSTSPTTVPSDGPVSPTIGEVMEEDDNEREDDEAWDKLPEASALAQARSDLLAATSVPVPPVEVREPQSDGSKEGRQTLSDIEEASNERSDTSSRRSGVPVAPGVSSWEGTSESPTSSRSGMSKTLAVKGRRSVGSVGDRAAKMRTEDEGGDTVERLM